MAEVPTIATLSPAVVNTMGIVLVAAFATGLDRSVGGNDRDLAVNKLSNHRRQPGS
jgi:hypothetical protein